MDETLGPFNLVLLAVPGLALKIAVRVMYARRSLAVADPLHLLLSQAGTIMLVLAALGGIYGLVGVGSLLIPLPIVMGIAIFMAIDRYRHGEHRALIWSLAAAARHNIPLSEAARAYADETQGDTGARAMALARGLEQGQPLSAAIRTARLRVATPIRLAIRLGENLGMLGPAMQQQIEDSAEVDAALRNVIGRLFYLGNVIVLAGGAGTFFLLKIMPVYQKMFEEYGIKLPSVTQFVIEVSENASFLYLLAMFGSLPLVVPILAVIVLGDARLRLSTVSVEPKAKDSFESFVFGLMWVRRAFGRIIAFLLVIFLVGFWPSLLLAYLCAAALFFVGWFPRDLPLVWRLFRRYDGALVMRGLALTVRRGLPLTEGLKLLGTTYPIQQIARRLQAATTRIEQGANWRQALVDAGLIGRADAAVLAAAEKVGHLDWALEEMADSALRRVTYRLQVGVQILFPIALLAIAFVVLLFALAAIVPLAALIQGLA